LPKKEMSFHLSMALTLCIEAEARIPRWNCMYVKGNESSNDLSDFQLLLTPGPLSNSFKWHYSGAKWALSPTKTQWY